MDKGVTWFGHITGSVVIIVGSVLIVSMNHVDSLGSQEIFYRQLCGWYTIRED